MISEGDRRYYLQLARDAIRGTGSLANGRGAPDSPPNAAVFVTLHRGGELRGCIGHLGYDQPLTSVVPRCAVAAATEDPRFPAVRPDEVDGLAIEISVLGPLEPIDGPDEIEIGTHGLVVEEGWHRGLLLPQVATEWQWDALAFLSHTCRKAGLHPDAWRHGAQLWRFQAEVFSEDERP